MLERVVENWLTKANERSFQQPFAFMLAAAGYTVVHVTRHCGAELGKDILAIDPDGVPCAFQLKGAAGSKIGLSDWRREIAAQVNDLISSVIVHPRIDPSVPHRSFLVSNGDLEEEVSLAIRTANDGWDRDGLPHRKLHVLVRGDLLKWANDLRSDFWPTRPGELKTLLELHLQDGGKNCDKASFCKLLQDSLALNADSEPVTPASAGRAAAAAAVLVALCLSGATERENHVAQVEAWMLFLCHVLAMQERWAISTERVIKELALAEEFIWNSIANLWDELKGRENLLEGYCVLDGPLHILPIREFWCKSLVACYAMSSACDATLARAIYEYVSTPQHPVWLWGEAAIPQHMACYWLRRRHDATMAPEANLLSMLKGIAFLNRPESDDALPPPYFSADDVISQVADSFAPQLLGTKYVPIDSSLTTGDFAGAAHMIEGITHVLARDLYRRHLGLIWDAVSRIYPLEFRSKSKWEFLLWRSKSGKNWTKSPHIPQSWATLRQEAAAATEDLLHDHLRSRPSLCALFAIVYPHRMTTGLMGLLDKSLDLSHADP